MAVREVVWEVTAAMFEQLHEYARMLDNAEIAQQDYIERLRSLGMPEAGPGTHVRIVLRSANPVSLGVHAAALRSGQLPGLPN